MDWKQVDPRAKTIEINTPTNREFFLIHGYTGSPTDFNDFSIYLYKKFNANVKVVRLVGHGKTISSLDKISYGDFQKQLELELKKDIEEGKEIIVIGYSFGGFLALDLASKYPVKGVINISMPYNLRYQSIARFVEFLSFFKKHWKKKFSSKEVRLRGRGFYYEHMHIKGLKVVRIAKREGSKSWKNITAPVFTIHSNKDYFSDVGSIGAIEKRVGSNIKDSFIIINKKRSHNLFYDDGRFFVYNKILKFIIENKLFGDKK